MGTKRIVARNVVWNQAGTATEMVVGFLVAPFLVRQLGQDGYGVWIIIASLTGYFGLLDLGIRGSVGRHIAYHRAAGDQAGINAVLSTALAVLGGTALAGLIAVLALQLVFFRIFQVPPALAGEARLALLLVGFNLAVMLLMNLFDATLWAFQRFDVLNAIDMPTAVIRAGLTFFLVGRGWGLVGLACLTLGTTIGAALTKAAASFWLDRGLRIRARLVSRAAAKQLFGYSIWLFLLSVTRLVSLRVAPLIIGALLTVELVTPYSIASRIIGYATAFVVASTGVLTPHVAGLAARNQGKDQQRLFIEGGRICFALALFFQSLFVLLGRPFILLWMRDEELARVSASLLVILGLGEMLAMSQAVTTSILLGIARHRLLAILGVVESAAAFLLAVALVRVRGLEGVAVAFAAPAVVCRGVLQIVYACQVLEVPVGRYLRVAILPALLAMLLPALGLAALVTWRIPTTWPELIGYGALFGVCFLGACLWLVGFGAVKARLLPAVVIEPVDDSPEDLTAQVQATSIS
jgi:O-antigen/teichoic acid export membrane protein